jgi:hypothetical protein
MDGNSVPNVNCMTGPFPTSRPSADASTIHQRLFDFRTIRYVHPCDRRLTSTESKRRNWPQITRGQFLPMDYSLFPVWVTQPVESRLLFAS